jgi:hypothetical protein
MTIQEKYEEICKFVKWSEKTDADKVKLSLMQKYTTDEIEMVVEFAVDLIDQLETAIEKYENTDGLKLNIGSDDGLHDVLAEIVSKGADNVQKYVNKPKLIETKYEADDYTESFLNCFPYKDDYEKMDLEYYQKVCEDMKAVVDWSKLNQVDSDKLNQILEEFAKGEFKKDYTYNTLHKFGDKVDLGAWIANTWTSGCSFYLKR